MVGSGDLRVLEGRSSGHGVCERCNYLALRRVAVLVEGRGDDKRCGRHDKVAHRIGDKSRAARASDRVPPQLRFDLSKNIVQIIQ